MKKEVKIVIFIVTLIIIIGSIFFVFINIVDKEKSIKIEEKEAYINNYYIYGNHFNVEGYLDIAYDNIDELYLVLRDKDDINTKINIVGKEEITFTLSNYINEGLNLDNIPVGNYKLYIKRVVDNNISYYKLINKSKSEEALYYTITRDNKNKRLVIDSKKNEEVSITVEKTRLPKDYYDIVIDPGHGGRDSGAVYKKYQEDALNLEVSLLLKKSLEKEGLKVKMTREKDINPGNRPGSDAYGEDSRVAIPNKVKAKYLLSIHHNSTDEKQKFGGVEIYASYMANLDFAKSIAKNLVDMASTTYSNSPHFKVSDGVYVRTFKNSDLTAIKEDAIKNHYLPYENISLSTNYYYMIRETGGAITGAYVDGRNSKYGNNLYVDSNMGVESLIVELGYIINDNDLKNLEKNKKNYIKALTKSIVDEINLKN